MQREHPNLEAGHAGHVSGRKAREQGGGGGGAMEASVGREQPPGRLEDPLSSYKAQEALGITLEWDLRRFSSLVVDAQATT